MAHRVLNLSGQCGMIIDPPEIFHQVRGLPSPTRQSKVSERKPQAVSYRDCCGGLRSAGGSAKQILQPVGEVRQAGSLTTEQCAKSQHAQTKSDFGPGFGLSSKKYATTPTSLRIGWLGAK